MNLSDLIKSNALPPMTGNLFKDFPGYTAGRYYPADLLITGYVAATFAPNSISYFPFLAREDHTFTGLSFYNTSTAQSGNLIRLGVYNSSGFRPNVLVAGPSPITLTAAAALRTASGSPSLTKDTLYFLAILCNASTTIASHISASLPSSWSNWHNVGIDTLGMANPLLEVFTEAYAYATLPTTATPGAMVAKAGQPFLYLKG